MAQVIRSAVRSQSFRNKGRRSTGDEIFGLITAGVLGLGVFGVGAKCKSWEHGTTVGYGRLVEEKPVEEKVTLLKGTLGCGSFGTVMAGKIVNTNEDVAVKVICGKENFRNTVSNEVEALEKVKQAGGHGNVVDYRFTVEHEKKKGLLFMEKQEESEYWILFERIIGEELFDKVCKKAMKQSEATSMASQVVDALKFLHDKVGIVHGDIKPENLLIKEDGTVKLIDFGSAMPISSEKRLQCVNGTETIGTVAYCSPEVLSAAGGSSLPELTSSIDIWSLGIVLYVALSSSHPFDLDGNREDPELAHAILRDPVRFDAPCWETVSSDMKGLIQSMLEKSPEKRITLDQLSQHPLLQ